MNYHVQLALGPFTKPLCFSTFLQGPICSWNSHAGPVTMPFTSDKQFPFVPRPKRCRLFKVLISLHRRLEFISNPLKIASVSQQRIKLIATVRTSVYPSFLSDLQNRLSLWTRRTSTSYHSKHDNARNHNNLCKKIRDRIRYTWSSLQVDNTVLTSCYGMQKGIWTK